jgi:hypothetical protein
LDVFILILRFHSHSAISPGTSQLTQNMRLAARISRPDLVFQRLIKKNHNLTQTERKQFLRTLVGEVKLDAQNLEVSISCRLPEAIMNGLVAGDCNERRVATLPFRVRVSDTAA